jgi:hypothetical protein
MRRKDDTSAVAVHIFFKRSLSAAAARSRKYVASSLHSSGEGTFGGMGERYEGCQGSGFWNEQTMMKTVLPL